MSSSLRHSIKRSIVGFRDSQVQQLRCRSTTSAIKAGLQAESPGRSRYGRRDTGRDRFRTDWDDRDIKRHPRASGRLSSAPRDGSSGRSGDVRASRSPRPPLQRASGAARAVERFPARSNKISSRRPVSVAGEGDLGFGGDQEANDTSLLTRASSGRRAAKKIFRNRKTEKDADEGEESAASNQSFIAQRKRDAVNEIRDIRRPSSDSSKKSHYNHTLGDNSAESRSSRQQRIAPDTDSRYARRAGEIEDRSRYSRQRGSDGENREQRKSRSIRSDSEDIPSAIPYTTASSQFLYGSNVVIAALTANRRKLYRLHMHKRSEAPNIPQIRRAATALNIDINRTADTGLLDRMSDGRPHNGVVLETSAIPARPIQHLERIESGNKEIILELEEQSEEDEAVNGTSKTISFPSNRHAFVLFLDGVTDPGNLGNIIRSAHFFGVDAIVVATNTCAPLSSAVVAKASAGACEAVTILTTSKPSACLHTSRANGWTLCAAVAPIDHEKDPQPQNRTLLTSNELAKRSLLRDKHCILMLGAEGEGLRAIYKKIAHAYVTIPRGAETSAEADVGVDSLNVATAGAVLMSAFAS